MNIKNIDKKIDKTEIVIELIRKGFTFMEAIEKVGLKNESK